MKIAALLTASTMFLQVSGCEQAAPPDKSPTPKPAHYQRFVPVPAPQAQMMGIPWTGFFALDTESGILCLTTEIYAPEAFKDLPSCATLAGGDSK